MATELHPIHTYALNIVQQFHENITIHFPPDGGMPVPPVNHTGPGGWVETGPIADFRVGIIGGGVGGLFAAMLLQHCGIQYEILERSQDLGGRLYTHRFSNDKNDYYDVGAMRFPKTPLMKDVFSLFDKINITDKVIPYHFSVNSNILYYNGVRKTRNDENITKAATFDIDGIPKRYAVYGWRELAEAVAKPFRDALVKDHNDGGKRGWMLLMRYDAYSVRTYMERFNLIVRSEADKKLLNAENLLPYPSIVVDWMELFNSSTNSYSHALSQMVLETLAFAWPERPGIPWSIWHPWDAKIPWTWHCIQGGSCKITEGMVEWLRKRSDDGSANIRRQAYVTAISQNDGNSANHRMQVHFGKSETATYAHVINTTALPCLKAVDLSKAKLTFLQQIAIRTLNYGIATKIAVKFATAWWTDKDNMKDYGQREPILGGQSVTDQMSRVIVYPSYGEKDTDRSHVLMVSYAWTSDAQALGALMTRPEHAEEVKRIVLRDLVNVHGFNAAGAAFLEKQWMEAFPFSWTSDPRTMGGAYAQFNPGQYSKLYPALTMPTRGKRLWFAGEVASAEHAWVSGALSASARVVKHIILASLGTESPQYKKYNTFWDDVGTPFGLPEGDTWTDPQGWTEELLAAQLAASELHDSQMSFDVPAVGV